VALFLLTSGEGAVRIRNRRQKEDLHTATVSETLKPVTTVSFYASDPLRIDIIHSRPNQKPRQQASPHPRFGRVECWTWSRDGQFREIDQSSNLAWLNWSFSRTWTHLTVVGSMLKRCLVDLLVVSLLGIPLLEDIVHTADGSIPSPRGYPGRITEDRQL
jgi:hypothetical protein